MLHLFFRYVKLLPLIILSMASFCGLGFSRKTAQEPTNTSRKCGVRSSRQLDMQEMGSLLLLVGTTTWTAQVREESDICCGLCSFHWDYKTKGSNLGAGAVMLFSNDAQTFWRGGTIASSHEDHNQKFGGESICWLTYGWLWYSLTRELWKRSIPLYPTD